MKFVLPVLLSLTLVACSHADVSTSTTKSSENVVTVMPGSYSMMVSTPAAVQQSPVAAGRISRYQRQVITPGGMDGELTPCAKNFDAVMDHLEILMKDQIDENNRIARIQAATPRYDF